MSFRFQSVGKPRDLFEECLENGKLETAATYLIILQNLEKLSVAREDATKLLNLSLQKCRWKLAADLTRFLKGSEYLKTPIQVISSYWRRRSM